MQQAELCEILPELKAKVENYKVYGVVSPTKQDINTAECRAYNLKLKAEQIAKAERWQRIQEARIHNLKILAIERQQRQEQQDIRLYEIVRENPQILSSIR